MSPSSRWTSVRRPFVCLLLALLLLGVAGLTAPARKAAARDGSFLADGGASPAVKPTLLPETNRVNGAGSVAAEDGRDFAGFYKEISAIDLGDTVRVSLRIKVFNYSGAD